MAGGTSADRQLAVYHRVIEGGGSAADGHRAVVDWQIEHTLTHMPS